MRLYDEILFFAFHHLAVPKEVLMCLNESARFGQQVIHDAVQKKHLRKTQIKSSHGSKEKTVRLYMITPEGIRYLIGTGIVPWLKFIDPESTKNASAWGKAGNSEAMKKRIAKVAEASLMFYLSGAEIQFPVHKSPELFSRDSSDIMEIDNFDEDTVLFSLEPIDLTTPQYAEPQRTRTYSDLMYNAMKEYNPDGIEQTLTELNYDTPDLPADLIRFTDVVRVKELVDIHHDCSFKPLAAKDFDRCRISGIADSRSKSVLVYSAHEVGFNWSSWMFEPDGRLLEKWSKKTITDPTIDKNDKKYAVLFVQNRFEFTKLYLDKAGRRKKVKDVHNKKRDPLGEGLSHFYVVPKTCVGTEFLRWLMLTNDDKNEKMLKKEAINSGKYEENIFSHGLFFPLRATDGTFVANGCMMDIIKIKQIEKVAKSNPERKFGVLCFDWQIEYYESILPNVKVIEWKDPNEKQ